MTSVSSTPLVSYDYAKLAMTTPSMEQPLDAVVLSELNWWTTEDDIRAVTDELGLKLGVASVTFSEHKVNGKSKGAVHVVCEDTHGATALKVWFDTQYVPLAHLYPLHPPSAADPPFPPKSPLQDRMISTQLTTSSRGNPFRTLPKDPPGRHGSAQPVRHTLPHQSGNQKNYRAGNQGPNVGQGYHNHQQHTQAQTYPSPPTNMKPSSNALKPHAAPFAPSLGHNINPGANQYSFSHTSPTLYDGSPDLGLEFGAGGGGRERAPSLSMMEIVSHGGVVKSDGVRGAAVGLGLLSLGQGHEHGAGEGVGV